MKIGMKTYYRCFFAEGLECTMSIFYLMPEAFESREKKNPTVILVGLLILHHLSLNLAQNQKNQKKFWVLYPHYHIKARQIGEVQERHHGVGPFSLFPPLTLDPGALTGPVLLLCN